MGGGGEGRESREIDAGEDTHIYIYKGREREGIERVSTHNMIVFVCKVDRAHHPLHLPLFQI